MKTISLVCRWCGKQFEKRIGEYNSQIKSGYKNFFCSLSCTGSYSNSIRSNKIYPIEKTCPTCNKKFMSSTSKKSYKFCSRSCASKGSVTEKRRMKAQSVASRNLTHNIQTIAAGLRVREGWKYVKIKEFLENIKEPYEFEYPLNGTDCIYDLALLKKNILVEFDEIKSHYGREERDGIKDKTAIDHGWKIVRIETGVKKIIEPDLLNSIFIKQ